MQTNSMVFWMLSTLALAANGQTVSSGGAEYAVADRSAFWRNWQKTEHLTNTLTGAIVDNVAQYTELGDGLCYQDQNGQWLDPQDLIEITDTGAAAVHGQHKAYFSPNLNIAGAITLRTASGQVFSSHPIGIYYFDSASGKTALVAPIQDCNGILLPPNQVLYSNAFNGLKASVLYVYAKNGFSQDIVLEEAPPPPDIAYGMNPATTRLQIWTSFDQAPVPVGQEAIVLKQVTDQQLPDLVDQLLFFQDVWFPVGAAFVLDGTRTVAPGQAAQIRVADSSDTNNVMTGKRLVLTTNQAVLVESVDYLDLLPKLKTLQQAALPASPNRGHTALAVGPTVPVRSRSAQLDRPLALASAPYRPQGLVFDYTLLSGSATNSCTFYTGQTYVISNSFSIGSGFTATFQGNTCIKYATNAYLLVSGPVSFPGLSQPPVLFTSTDDNLYGDAVTNATGNPNYASSHHLSFYYDSYSTTVQNARFRWAQKAVQYDASQNQCYITYYLNQSTFENCNIGVYENLPCSSLSLSYDTSCNVVTPISVGSGSYSGSITVNCGIQNVSHMSGGQAETTVAINPVNPSNIVVFSVLPQDTGALKGPGFFKGVSTNNGTSWQTNIIATGSDIPTAYADPWASFDAFGNLFLAYIDSSFHLVIALSTNNAANLTVQTNFSSSLNAFDKPMVTTGPGGTTAAGSVWVAYSGIAAAITVTGAAVTNLGQVRTFSTPTAIVSQVVDGANLAIGPTGQVVCAWLEVGTPAIYAAQNSNGLSNPNWTVTLPNIVNLSANVTIPAATSTGISGFPYLAWDRSNGPHRGRLYLVYTDYASSVTNTDIKFTYSDDNGKTFTNVVNINTPTNSLSHFSPAVAVDQTSTNGNVAVCWYDCRDDPNNVKTRGYCAVSQDSGVTFSRNFQLEPGQSNATVLTKGAYFCYGDYTGMDYRSGFLRFVWADNSNTGTSQTNPDGTGGMDVYTCTVGH